MANDRYPHKPHFILKNTGAAEPFRLRGGGTQFARGEMDPNYWTVR